MQVNYHPKSKRILQIILMNKDNLIQTDWNYFESHDKEAVAKYVRVIGKK